MERPPWMAGAQGLLRQSVLVMSFLERLPTAAPQSGEAQLQFSLPSQGQIYEMRQPGRGGVWL